MAPPNLTRTDAERRAALLRVADYRVEIDLTDGAGRPGSDTFPTVTTVRFSCAEPGADSWIDLVAADVATATLNGTENPLAVVTVSLPPLVTTRIEPMPL